MVALLTPEEVAALLGVAVQTLYNWRSAGVGPASLKVGKYVRYEPAAVDAYIASLRPKSNLIPFPEARTA